MLYLVVIKGVRSATHKFRAQLIYTRIYYVQLLYIIFYLCLNEYNCIELAIIWWLTDNGVAMQFEDCNGLPFVPAPAQKNKIKNITIIIKYESMVNKSSISCVLTIWHINKSKDATNTNFTFHSGLKITTTDKCVMFKGET